MNRLNNTWSSILLIGLIISFACGTNSGQGSTDHDSNRQHGHHMIAEGESAGIAEINFETLEFDFGTIHEGEKVSHTFYFSNTGKVPLIIQNASPSCGCTVPDWSKEPIPPGGSGQIEVSFDSQGKSETQNRTVSVVANTEPSITQLRIKGVVIAKSTHAMGPVRKN